ncbi:MAG: hypothetical protein JHC38_08875 [Thiotrichales bacterium]|nr:hypothetical protein [Thiotrichales bacterium]
MIQPTGVAITALQEEFANPQWLYFIVVLFGIILILWAIMELVSSLIFRKTISDTIQATLTNVSTSINVNTQYLTDSLIKLAQLGHAERLEHIRMSQMFINEAFTTAKTSIVLDELKDMVKELETGGGGK